MIKLEKTLEIRVFEVILIIILVATTVVKFFEVSHYNFPFTMDQGRDMVDIRHMVVTMSPRLIGPTTSINGLFLGPFWYYFNLPPFIIGQGDPSFVVFWQIIWYQISVFLLWRVLKSKYHSLAFFISLFLLLMPTSFNTARYFWNANSMTFFTILYFAAFFYCLEKENNWSSFALGLAAGVALQIEAAFGIVLFPFAILYFIYNRLGKRRIQYLCSGFFITLLPQIVFELRHQFIMTNLLFSEFSGHGNMLGEKFSVPDRLTQRLDHFMLLLFRSSHLPPNYLPWLYFAGAVTFFWILIKSSKRSSPFTFWSVSVLFMVFTAVFYITFPQSLKEWYTYGFSIPLIIFFGSFINYVYNKKSILVKTVAILVTLGAIYYSFKSQIDYTRDVALKPSNDRSSLGNELAAIDWVYQKANGSAFKVYSYLPSVYDFPYNHLFWWYGSKFYGYHPSETAYLPGQPEYIQDKDKIWTKMKDVKKVELVFLIIEEDKEMPTRTQAWLGNFSKLCQNEEKTFSWGTKVVMMSGCMEIH